MAQACTNIRFTLVITSEDSPAPHEEARDFQTHVIFEELREQSSTVPSASTASNPRTYRDIGPYRITLRPPAAVAMLPPIWHCPFAPRSRGIRIHALRLSLVKSVAHTLPRKIEYQLLRPLLRSDSCVIGTGPSVVQSHTCST